MPRLILFIALPILIAACSSGSPPPAAAASARPTQPARPSASPPTSEPVIATREQLLDRYVGNWIVFEASPNRMQAQTVVWIRREGDHLAIFEDGRRELGVRTLSVDAGTGEVALIETLPDSEAGLRLAPLATASSPDSARPDIAMTWEDGTRWTLAGGWPPGRDDPADETIASIREGGRRLSYRVETRVHCYMDLNFRYRALCSDQALSRRNGDLMQRFIWISGEYPDSHRTYQAAIRDLDACADRPCLDRQYAAWAKYLDDNYPHQQAVD